MLTTLLSNVMVGLFAGQHTVEHKMEDYTTVMKVVSPSGAKCHVKSDSSFFGEQDFEIPFKFKAQPEYFYTFDCKLPDGKVWHQKLEPKANHTTIVTIGGGASPETKAPATASDKVAMAKDDFDKLLRSVAKESFEDGKLNVVKVAAGRNHFNAEQVGSLVDAFDFSDGKTKALELVVKRIVDPKNAHTILGHFEFDSDKEAAQKILSAN